MARLASNDRHGLEHLSVFDINTLLSKQRQHESDDVERDMKVANKTFQRMMMAKKPDVILILQCQGRSSSNNYIRRLSSSERLAGTIDVFDVKGQDALVVRGFHPSTYLRDDYAWERNLTFEERKLRVQMLEYCFKISFRLLEGKRHQEKDLEIAWRQSITSPRSVTRPDAWIKSKNSDIPSEQERIERKLSLMKEKTSIKNDTTRTDVDELASSLGRLQINE